MNDVALRNRFSCRCAVQMGLMTALLMMLAFGSGCLSPVDGDGDGFFGIGANGWANILDASAGQRPDDLDDDQDDANDDDCSDDYSSDEGDDDRTDDTSDDGGNDTNEDDDDRDDDEDQDDE